jgi:hypothetical protein
MLTMQLYVGNGKKLKINFNGKTYVINDTAADLAKAATGAVSAEDTGESIEATSNN